MDLDRESLELMLNLLDTDSRIKDALDSSGMNKKELEKNKQKVITKLTLVQRLSMVTNNLTYCCFRCKISSRR